MVVYWKADRRPSSVYSSHGVIWRAYPAILLRTTMGLGVSLRSLTQKHLKNLQHDLLAFLFHRLFTQHIVFWDICAIKFPFSFSFGVPPFGVWVVLLCFIMSLLICNTMFQFVYHFWNGIVCLLLVSLHFCQVMVLKVYLELLFSNRVALVQYLFICCLLFKLMKKLFRF